MSDLLTDVLKRTPHFQVARKQHDLKKKLKVTFAGEPGLDMGGLTKEWFLLLIRQIFQEEYGEYHDENFCVYTLRINTSRDMSIPLSTMHGVFCWLLKSDHGKGAKMFLI